MKTTYTLKKLGRHLLPVAVGIIAASTFANNQASANEITNNTTVATQDTISNLQNEVNYRQERIAKDQLIFNQATPEKINELKTQLNIEGLTTTLADKKFALETAETDVKIYEYQLEKLKSVESAKEYYATLTPELEKAKENLITATSEFKKSEMDLANAEHYLGKYTNAADYLENSKKLYTDSLNELNKAKSEFITNEIKSSLTNNSNLSLTNEQTKLPLELLTVLNNSGLMSQNTSKTSPETTEISHKTQEVKNSIKDNVLPKTAAFVNPNVTYAGLSAGLLVLSSFMYRRKNK